jgi:hypothetical protein
LLATFDRAEGLRCRLSESRKAAGQEKREIRRDQARAAETKSFDQPGVAPWTLPAGAAATVRKWLIVNELEHSWPVHGNLS